MKTYIRLSVCLMCVLAWGDVEASWFKGSKKVKPEDPKIALYEQEIARQAALLNQMPAVHQGETAKLRYAWEELLEHYKDELMETKENHDQERRRDKESLRRAEHMVHELKQTIHQQHHHHGREVAALHASLDALTAEKQTLQEAYDQRLEDIKVLEDQLKRNTRDIVKDRYKASQKGVSQAKRDVGKVKKQDVRVHRQEKKMVRFEEQAATQEKLANAQQRRKEAEEKQKKLKLFINNPLSKVTSIEKKEGEFSGSGRR
ncbi:hypothetical protein [Candidatus Hepatobacter penaei]|uniref:hypothetical protein n=1 Tax=Candidatus Hepatobacter penaei TaxID=1274402 RepID=UPI0004F2B902|nr:hypothetical protein [Candidatus Hepatobacter penaei]